ncbi:hypothetical protein [Sulfuricurvum sp.]|uniref:hypothetical protein n=1 Tax=Sulfuricurvum sp. TaxID=2025608 RepID=UPI0026070215|nr:hypothetical protein [Sulfuricurvum sp.]MDD2782015.1 hypothetical protein [Sulfuricurvum sp.]
MRHAFGLPQVLLIILFVGGIVTVTMRYASLGAQHYADSYTREQAELFLQSATEAALLRLSTYDRSSGTCMPNVTVRSSDGKFEGNVTIEHYYLADGSTCSNVAYTPIQSEESHGMVSIRIIVTSDNTNAKILHPIRLERRSLQRP